MLCSVSAYIGGGISARARLGRKDLPVTARRKGSVRPHNRTLLSAIPDVYTPATGTLPEKHLTYYRVFTGPETPFQGPLGPRMPSSFQDGTSNTFLVVEAGEPVPWTKPDTASTRGCTVPVHGST